MSPPSPRSPGWIVLLLALPLTAACAAASGGSEGAATAGGDVSAREGPTCQGDCWLRVDNRLRQEAEVSMHFQRALEDLGVVRANQTEVFHLEDFTGEHVEIWVRDTETRDLIGLDCIRQFRRVHGRREGRMVLGEGGPAGTSGC